MDMKIELVALPVTAVDRAKAFYVDRIGFTADHDYAPSPELRFVELTFRGVECSDVDQQDWGRFVYFADPDGNTWALQQMPPTI
ncbi:MAG: VOC family protein [Citricoccus sp.]